MGAAGTGSKENLRIIMVHWICQLDGFTEAKDQRVRGRVVRACLGMIGIRADQLKWSPALSVGSTVQ